MQTFDVQSIEIKTSCKAAFFYIADPLNLPLWAQAFASVSAGKAVMRTPAGEVDIELAVASSEPQGTVDWHMTFPDGSVGIAYSRVVKLNSQTCAYSFVLTAPPVPLEQLEGALQAQSNTLAEELQVLKANLENND